MRQSSSNLVSERTASAIPALVTADHTSDKLPCFESKISVSQGQVMFQLFLKYQSHIPDKLDDTFRYATRHVASHPPTRSKLPMRLLLVVKNASHCHRGDGIFTTVFVTSLGFNLYCERFGNTCQENVQNPHSR